MGRSPKTYNRSAPRFRVKATVLIICEDTKSGRRYLEDAKRYFNVDAVVEVLHSGKTDPRGIVTHALARADEFDTIYCVIDRDTHETFDEAVELSKSSKKIELIVSYPSFEFWLFLHFEFSRRAYVPTGNRSPGDLMLKALTQCEGMAGYTKGTNISIFDDLLTRLPKARDRAEIVLSQAYTENEMNPSTNLHHLLDAFEVLAK